MKHTQSKRRYEITGIINLLAEGTRDISFMLLQICKWTTWYLECQNDENHFDVYIPLQI